MKKLIMYFIRRLGYDLVPYVKHFPSDYDGESIDIINQVMPYTMTGSEIVFALIQAIRYVVRAKIPGVIVECGVWRGGSMMAAAYALKKLGVENRELFLYDTFEGMTKPTEFDTRLVGDVEKRSAVIMYEQLKNDAGSDWSNAGIEEVSVNLSKTGYPSERIHYVKGKVEDTLPHQMPEKIAFLRLDTDWYESTRHEFIHLFPLLSPGGVLLLDDYGYWQGSRKATDEYLEENNISILLNRVGFARIGIKTG